VNRVWPTPERKHPEDNDMTLTMALKSLGFWSLVLGAVIYIIDPLQLGWKWIAIGFLAALGFFLTCAVVVSEQPGPEQSPGDRG
jgi:hypothetical protein